MNHAEGLQLATLVCQPLFAAWGGAAGAQKRPVPLNRELTRLGLLAGDAEVVAADAGYTVATMHAQHAYREAAALGRQCIALLDQADAVRPFPLLHPAALSCRIIGDVEAAHNLLERALATTADQESSWRAQALAELGELLHQEGEVEKAEQYIRQAEELFARLGEEGNAAVASGRLADILYARGQLDEALAIRQEKQLPVYERLGDVRELAVTHGQIADILFRWGRLDEALAIRQEKQLPVYERLGDVRELVICRTNMAITQLQRGRSEDAAAAMEYLLWSLQAAQERGLPEAEQIARILQETREAGKEKE
jgi:ATP/maltotriose-dependent transcriptional regulator MalT